MPIYEYKCNKCGVFEAMQGIKDAPLRKCPTCKGKVERLISRGSFILKGSGWYATDYGKGKPSGAESDSSASAPSTPTTNGSTASSDSSSKPAESKPTPESKAPAKSKSSSEKSVSAKAAD
jgi:putative FmdB family regulatory protein